MPPWLSSVFKSQGINILDSAVREDILKLNESCIANPKSEILNWTVKWPVQFEISKFRI